MTAPADGMIWFFERCECDRRLGCDGDCFQAIDGSWVDVSTEQSGVAQVRVEATFSIEATGR